MRPVYDRNSPYPRGEHDVYNNVLFFVGPQRGMENTFFHRTSKRTFLPFGGVGGGPSSSSAVFIPFLGIRGMCAHICVVSRKIEQMDVNGLPPPDGDRFYCSSRSQII